MSTNNFAFFTPEQLREARKHAVAVNKQRNMNEFNDLFKHVTQEVQEEINAKLLAATQSAWEKTDAVQCSLRFSANELNIKAFERRPDRNDCVILFI